MAKGSVTITHKDPSNFDLTPFFTYLKWTEVGSEQGFPQLILRLTAKKGRFITTGTRKIDRLDRLDVKLTDKDSNVWERNFEVQDLLPTRGDEGDILELHCLDQSWHVGEIHFAKQHEFESGFVVTRDSLDAYNVLKGGLQPAVIDHDNTTGNKLGQWTANHYEFNVSETRVYEAILQVIDALGAAVSAGGELEFYEIYFIRDSTNIDQIKVRIFPSGSLPVSPLTITRGSLTDRVRSAEGDLKIEKATIQWVWGDPKGGSLPIDFSVFVSEEEAFDNHPDWDTTLTYPQDAFVIDVGIVYKALRETQGDVPASSALDWASQTFTPSTDYSIWTNLKATTVGKNSGLDPSGATGGAACFDANIIVIDEEEKFFRTIADWRGANTDPVPNKLKMRDGAAGFQFYRGFRILASGTPATGDFTLNGGQDRFGKNYNDSIVQHRGTQFTGSDAFKNWDVKYDEASATNWTCMVRSENQLYVFDGADWLLDTTEAINECSHAYTILENEAGTHPTQGANSALHYRYVFTSAADLLGITGEYYNIGMWANVVFPLPLTTDNGIGEFVGGLYGGDNLSLPEPATLDTRNMHLTHSGGLAFNETDGEDSGPLSSLNFFQKFTLTLQRVDTGAPELPVRGNFKFKCICGDTSDNVVSQDFICPIRATWVFQSLDLDSFETYRGRRPRDTAIAWVLPPKELEILNVFEWKNLKWMIIQLQEVYDDNGRFHPLESNLYHFEQPIPLRIFFGGQTDMSLDSFFFGKPLLAFSGAAPSISTINRTGTIRLESDFMDEAGIFNLIQLRNVAKTRNELNKFRYKSFTLPTKFRLDFDFGDSAFYKDSNLVSDADDGANTIKGVVKKITQEISKTSDGPSGYGTQLQLIKRFTT